MTRPAFRLRNAVAALLALALLAFAQVRSTTMQAVELAGADCGMSAAAMPGMGRGHATPGKTQHAACPYCAAAAHAPVSAFAPALPTPVVVAWTPAVACPSPPARGPPALQPRARGPPPLTA